MVIKEFESKLNEWGREQVPFLFFVDFELERPLAWKLSEIPKDILFSINGFVNCIPQRLDHKIVSILKHPISFSEYKSKFDSVKDRIRQGDSYLTNLTIRTKIEVNCSLEELFFRSTAKYKVCWKNKFLVFSPEIFIQIRDGKIFSYPMKGTIDASLQQAAETILADAKELSEHVTIVDLIRNDLSRVSDKVVVNRFRYVDEIQTSQKTLLQVSSEISGRLPKNHNYNIGSILVSMLPAGSVSGAPKKKTLQIILEAEKMKRGYYTGVVGYFDGQDLDAGVMIRFIEQDENQFYYRSGGGITSQSVAQTEYEEVLDKIYAPVY
jgi:para-aminobenzoate synthetase component 1